MNYFFSLILCSTCLFLLKEVQSRVTFQSDDFDEMSTSNRHHLQPLLGYDWIAGMPYWSIYFYGNDHLMEP